MKNIKKWAAAVPLLGINALICFTRAFGFVCLANFASASELGLYLSLCTYVAVIVSLKYFPPVCFV